MSGTVAVTYLRSTGHVWHGRTGKQERTKKQIDGSTATATNHNTRRARNYYHWEKNNAPRSATDTQRDRRRPCQQHSEYSAMTINYNANTSQQSTARYFTVHIRRRTVRSGCCSCSSKHVQFGFDLSDTVDPLNPLDLYSNIIEIMKYYVIIILLWNIIIIIIVITNWLLRRVTR